VTSPTTAPTAAGTGSGSVLEIRDLHVTVGEGDDVKEILRGVDLTVRGGETHAIMGPNGSGKSTLAYSIAGHPKYTITGGTVTLDGEDVLAMSAPGPACSWPCSTRSRSPASRCRTSCAPRPPR
jgi:Fe-S cluster assembly ATP-binding protein